ncbi:insulinase family protein [Chlamydiia bacterium]|nr:insulinase family protein [Chlamydiia bacterium]
MSVLRQSIIIFIYSVCFVLITVNNVFSTQEIGVMKHPQDKTNYFEKTLENGLRVVICSDPRLSVSSVSMNVGIGSLNDPKEYKGMAHFLEHLLFLGTEKYPDVDEYKKYISMHGGYSNAYTATDHTNYHFQISHNALEGAIDRFSQFFIAPMFDAQYIDKERRAVHSEFKKNIENDNRRRHHLIKKHIDQNHPKSKFSTGNETTLKDVNRDKMIRFYNDYYSSHQMTLAIVSPLPLNILEKWTDYYFTDIKERSIKQKSIKKNYYNGELNKRIITIKPIQDRSELYLHFPIPHQFFGNPGEKMNNLIASLIGDESDGSLLSLLKKDKLATGLNAWIGGETAQYGSATILITLTNKGVDNTEMVTERFFSYINMLKESDFAIHQYDESKRLSELERIYGDKGDGTTRAIHLAINKWRFPQHPSFESDYIYNTPNHTQYRHLLSYLRPNNMICMLSDPSVVTTHIDDLYQTRYGYISVDEDTYQRNLSPRFFETLHHPEENTFVPMNVSVPKQGSGHLETPDLIYNAQNIKIYHAKDQIFQRPQTSYRVYLNLSDGLKTPYDTVIMHTYVKALKESLNEQLYPALVSGLDFEVNTHVDGISIHVNGYNESTKNALKIIIDAFKTLSIEQRHIDIAQIVLKKEWYNRFKTEVYNITFEFLRSAVYKGYVAPDERLNLLNQYGPVTYDDLKSFHNKLVNGCEIKMLIYGDANRDVVNDLLDDLVVFVKRDRLIYSGLDHELKLSPGVEFKVDVQTTLTNSCILMTYVNNDRTIVSEALGRLFAAIIEPSFYTQLRTEKQLGYIVFSGYTQFKYSDCVYLLVQSADYDNSVIEMEMNNFIKSVENTLSSLSESGFNKVRSGVVSLLEQKPTNISEQASYFFNNSIRKKETFDHRDRLLKHLKDLQYKNTINELKLYLDQSFKLQFCVEQNEDPLQQTKTIDIDIDMLHLNVN